MALSVSAYGVHSGVQEGLVASSDATTDDDDDDNGAPVDARPWEREVVLPSARDDASRERLVEAIADLLVATKTWADDDEIGDSNFLILTTRVQGMGLYVQFLSDPFERGLWWEVESGFYGAADSFHPTDAQRRAMTENGFSDGREGNFQRIGAFARPEDARPIAETTLRILGDVFGWTPETAITARLHASRQATARWTHDSLSFGMVEGLLLRHGIDARRRSEANGARDDESAAVDAAMNGLAFEVFLSEPDASKKGRFRRLSAKAIMPTRAPGGAVNLFNRCTPDGRSWIDGDGQVAVAMSTSIAGLSDASFRAWLSTWRRVLTTARRWYRRVDATPHGEPLAFAEAEFGAIGEALAHAARTHVRASAEWKAIAAFMEHVRSFPDADVTVWDWFAGHAAAHPDDAVPVSAKFPSGARASDVTEWVARLDGIDARVREDGLVDVKHVVEGARLVIDPARVRAIAFERDAFALRITLEAGGAPIAVVISGDDVRFTLDAAAAEVGWFETRARLRLLERDVAWAAVARCERSIAWMQRALDAAARAGIACASERERFEAIAAFARRS